MKPESPDDLHAELERARAELHAARERIAAMEMSKFWKLRNAWWRLKGALAGGAAARSEFLRPGSPPEWRMPDRTLMADPDPTGGRFAGKRVLFVLPVAERGGGANVVLREAAAMRSMGVDARVVNLRSFEGSFRGAYPEPIVPIAFASPQEIPALARGFDAVVATANRSVAWLLPLAAGVSAPILGYYVQDFEPNFYPEGSEGRAHALASYTIVPGLVRFAKTEWNGREVESRCGVSCAVVGPSVNLTLFRPASAVRPEPPPIHVTAMIRPSSPRRQPEFTLRVFARVRERFGSRVAFTLFGVTADDTEFRRMPKAFPYDLLGVVGDETLATLFRRVHIFADFSSYQAMGLTSMEAMACGAAVIAPAGGGTPSFARDGQNALVVDTSSEEACVAALARLVEEPGLAARLGGAAQRDMEAFPPERAAARVLECLFEPGVSRVSSERGP